MVGIPSQTRLEELKQSPHFGATQLRCNTQGSDIWCLLLSYSWFFIAPFPLQGSSHSKTSPQLQQRVPGGAETSCTWWRLEAVIVLSSICWIFWNPLKRSVGMYKLVRLTNTLFFLVCPRCFWVLVRGSSRELYNPPIYDFESESNFQQESRDGTIYTAPQIKYEPSSTTQLKALRRIKHFDTHVPDGAVHTLPCIVTLCVFAYIILYLCIALYGFLLCLLLTRLICFCKFNI